MTRSLSANFRRVRDEIEQFGQEKKDAALARLTTSHSVFRSSRKSRPATSTTCTNCSSRAWARDPSPDDFATVGAWALAKRAPFHRGKNSVADALLLTVYATAMTGALGSDDRYAFVSANVKDFSAVGDDNRLPHPGLANLFDGPQSGYFLSLVAALAEHFPEDFDDMLEEFAFHEEPRNWEEIRSAERVLRPRLVRPVARRRIKRGRPSGGHRERRRTRPRPGRGEVRRGESRALYGVRVGDDQRQAVGAALGHGQRVGLPRYVTRRPQAPRRCVSA